jgi:hypothetical protein
VYVELDVDGRPVYRATLDPAGLWNDGPSAAYARFKLPAGRHTLEARLRDSGATDRFDYAARHTVDLVPGQNFVVDFRGPDGGFIFGNRGSRDVRTAQL